MTPQITPDIIGFCKISDRLAIGGQPTTNQFTSLKNYGISLVFQVVVKEAPYSVNHESFHLNKLNITHQSMDISLNNPTVNDVKYFIDIMDNALNENVFIHCAAGYCTSGLLAIYLMIREGMSLEYVTTKIIPNWHPTLAWQGLIEEVSANIA